MHMTPAGNSARGQDPLIFVRTCQWPSYRPCLPFIIARLDQIQFKIYMRKLSVSQLR